MFDVAHAVSPSSESHWTDSGSDCAPTFEQLAARLQLPRRQVDVRKHVFRSGQPMQAVFYVHAGCFKTCLVSEDGREKITGFRMRGDFLGLESLGAGTYSCDVVGLDVGEVWEIPRALIQGSSDESNLLRERLTYALAGEMRRDWQWMLVGTLSAEQRVVEFLLDLARRQRAMGFSARQLVLRMTRADLGNFLSLQLETVTRVLSRLAGLGLIGVARRDIRIERPDALQALLSPGALAH
jgi:CRP/FNR family transcriptional regulator